MNDTTYSMRILAMALDAQIADLQRGDVYTKEQISSAVITLDALQKALMLAALRIERTTP